MGLRWFVLTFLCVIAILSYDLPNILHEEARAMFSSNSSQTSDSPDKYFVSNLLTVYTVLYTALPAVGGILVDKIGHRIMLIALSLVVFVGMIVQSCSYYSNAEKVDIPMLLLGRIIFVLGAESLTVCTFTVIAEWFLRTELALALAIHMTVLRVGMALGSEYRFMQSTAATSRYLNGVSWLAVELCGVSICLCGVIFICDYKAHEFAERRFRRRSFQDDDFNVETDIELAHYGAVDVVHQQRRDFGIAFQEEDCRRDRWLHHPAVVSSPSSDSRQSSNSSMGVSASSSSSSALFPLAEESPRSTDCADGSSSSAFLSFNTWLLIFSAFFFYCSLTPFTAINSKIFAELSRGADRAQDANAK